MSDFQLLATSRLPNMSSVFPASRNFILFFLP
jgi:hypothetical protein